MKCSIIYFIIYFIPVFVFSQYKNQKLNTPYLKTWSHKSVSTKGYYDITNELPNGYVKNGTVDYTQQIQNALNNNTRLVLPNFPIQVSGIYPNSNTVLYFQENSKLILKPNNKERYQIIGLHGVENVTIYNAKLKGDLDEHLGTKGEWGFGIDIRNSQNIKLFNTTITNCWGDGIVIVDTKRNFIEGRKSLYKPKNIIIENLNIDYVRRNGITIANGENVSITNAIISNVYGKSPKAGIDIEPDNSNGTLEDIILKDIKVYNVGIGLDIHLVNYTSKESNNNVNLKIENFEINNAISGIYIAGYNKVDKLKNLKGLISISNFTTKNVLKPFVKRKQYGLYPVIKINSFNFYENNKVFKNDKNRLLEHVVDKTNFEYK